MSKISKFDCLPNELIICIFDYLESAENFKSFFNYNDRFRKLVKSYVNYNRRALDKDIERFSTLHSWYKHLNFIDGGVTFYMVPIKGEQAQYNFNPSISDHIGIHWHFWKQESIPLTDKRIEKISQKYPIKLNPTFHPDGSAERVLVGKGPDFIRQYYPEEFQRFEKTLFQKSFNSAFEAYEFNKDDFEFLMKYIKENEPKRLRNNIKQAANSIWKEIQALEDINILEIRYAWQTAGTDVDDIQTKLN